MPKAANVHAALDLLTERWPKVFLWAERRRVPLKVGIREDILAELNGAITPQELSAALGVYCRNHVYLRRLRRAGAMRIDLNGAPKGVVTAEQADFAILQLSQQVWNDVTRKARAGRRYT